MRLEQVVLHKYGQFDHLELDIPAEEHVEFGRLRLTLIVGQNGTGKTTIFRFITDIFDRKPRANMDGCSVTYRLQRSHSLEFGFTPPWESPSAIVISTYSPTDGFSQIVDSGYRITPLKYLGLDAERVAKEWKRGPSDEFLKEIVVALLREGERRRQVSLLLDRIGYSDRILLRLRTDDRPLDWRLSKVKHGHPDANFSFFERQLYSSALERWASFRSQLRGLSPGHSTRLVIDVADLYRYPTGVSGFVEDLKTMGSARGSLAYYPISALVFERDGKWIPLEGFSSGERALFFRFLGLLREVTDGSLVLIDEPEIHLHPEWVQRFVGLLVSLFRDVNAHILIASHSPLIAADVPADCILGLKKEGNQVLPYTVEDRSLGTSPSVILREVFGVKDELGDFTGQIIERAREHIRKGQSEKALALYDLLGDSDEKFRLFRELRQLRERGN